MNRIIGILLVVGVLFILTGCGGGVKEEVAVLETTMGQIVLGFYPDDAPNHVENFKKLAKEGVYNGVLFHRVIPGFVIQGGDPKTADPSTPKEMYGTGGTGNMLQAEFNDNPHQHGTLSMARAQDPNSADAQFYICLGRIPHLDGKYTVFGEVLKGLDVVDAIGAVETEFRDIPVTPVRIESVTIIAKKDAGLE